MYYEDLSVDEDLSCVYEDLAPADSPWRSSPSCSIRCAFALRPSGGTNRDSLSLSLLLLQTIHPGHWRAESAV